MSYAAMMLVALQGCGGVTLRTSYTRAALVPLSTFPRVYLVATGSTELESDGASRLALQTQALLEAEAVEVVTLSPSELERRRSRGELRAPSLTLWLALAYRRGFATRSFNEPETVCGPAGCITRQRNRLVQEPTVEATLTVEVFDAPSAERLQRLALRTHAQRGDVEILLYDRALDGLGEKLEEALTPQLVREHHRLIEVPGSEDALALLEGGEIHEGREALEALWPQMRERDVQQRAAFLYDLGLARRFDPITLAEDASAHFDAAERAFSAAQRLDPSDRYALALEACSRHRRSHLQRQEQAAASSYNRRLDATPPAPGGYQP